MWPSTTKYFSPFFSYTVPPRTPERVVPSGHSRSGPVPLGFARVQLARHRPQVEAEVIRGILRVGDENGPVVGVDHPPVVRGHILFELRAVEVARILAERFGDLVVDDLHVPVTV